MGRHGCANRDAGWRENFIIKSDATWFTSMTRDLYTNILFVDHQLTKMTYCLFDSIGRLSVHFLFLHLNLLCYTVLHSLRHSYYFWLFTPYCSTKCQFISILSDSDLESPIWLKNEMSSHILVTDPTKDNVLFFLICLEAL